MDPGAWIQNLLNWLNASTANGTVVASPIEEFVRSFTLLVAQLTDAVAAFVVAVAVVRGLLAYVAGLLGLMFQRTGRPQSRMSDVPKEEIRLALGRSLALALEFEVGADILRSAITPTWNDIFQLGAIILLRTVLNYFLQRELDAEAKRAAGMLATEPAAEQPPPSGRSPLAPVAAPPPDSSA